MHCVLLIFCFSQIDLDSMIMMIHVYI
jgi:hypothetical protein